MKGDAGHLEREVKLGVWPGFRLPDLDGVLEGIEGSPAPEQRLDALYFDTPDLRLARSGITFRHRSPEGWTLKLPQDDGDADILARHELTVAGDERAVPAELASLVTAWVRTSSLAPVARLHTLRRRVLLSDGNGAVVGEVADDEVSVLHGRRLALRFREVEVELAADAPEELLERVVTRLRAAGAGAVDPVPKVTRALGPKAFEPPELAERHADVAGTAASVIHQALRASVRRLLDHDLAVRLGGVEGVHQARVATRRMRSDLRTFRPLLDEGWANGLRVELGWLAGALGEVRDADVLLERLGSAAARLRPVDAEAAGVVLARLEVERTHARGRLLRVLDAPRYLQLLDQLVDAVSGPSTDGPSPRWLLPEADVPAFTVLPTLVQRPWKHLREAVQAAGPDAGDEQLHEVRIKAKRCRYAAEAAAPAVGKPARRLADVVAGVQEVLGDHHDAVVAEAWLRSAAQELDPAGALVAGQLIAVQRAAAEASRDAWPAAWRKADEGKLRAWLTT